jgi:Zn-dependent protease
MFAILSLIVLFFSIMLHEIAHGSAALQLGDPTAKHAGRLTLNPVKHIDPFGTIILPVLLLFLTAGHGPIIGWAKPVPINPFNFKDQRWGTLKVSLAGPATNFMVAILFGLAIRFISLPDPVALLFGIIVIYNFAWGIFNLIPIPPLDGSHILFSLLPSKFDKFRVFLQQYSLFILILFIFVGLNLIFYGARLLFYLIAGQASII